MKVRIVNVYVESVFQDNYLISGEAGKINIILE